MDTLINFAKENFQLITLLVGVLGVIVAFVDVLCEHNAKKRKKQNKGTPDENQCLMNNKTAIK